MSSSDILDVLNIQSSHVQKKRPGDAKPAGPKKKKQGTMNRELYNLIGQNAPPIAMEKTSKFKSRLNSSVKTTPWSYTSFVNEARQDGLELHHWIKGSSDLAKDKEYPFAKFNSKINIPELTEDNYKESLGSEDWSFEETKHLFELANDFDINWFVIYDRYDFDGAERSLEDLKERFYDACEKLLTKKYESSYTDEKTQTLIDNLKSFDKSKELERKEYLSRLLQRNPTEIAEEQSLVIEARKFELSAKKMLQERAGLLQLLDSAQSTGSVSQYLTSQGLTQLYNNLMLADKGKKRKVEVPVPPQIDSSLIRGSDKHKKITAASIAPESAKKPEPLTHASEMLAKRLSAEEREIYGLTIHQDKISAGVNLRSNKISSYKPAVQAKIASTLNELGISTKPTIPTGKVCEKFDELLHAISILLETKRQTDKLETEIRLIQSQRED
ncbi:unnamed protein product [Kuraishia capsulata CBS 1993]|uniref:SWR1-complex protein 4 n=1 Tax=Kuraishia capsulata CBS 1993 TaxID=1382522 RepID=W6MM00_9ASCO|nr:uncharacterized protein KUCA_T00003186001 [Kuraishia capsulata CBS 1993]CDK27208.1 unnamed protein product [Kuraishia capsulata CBS 1993]